MKNLYIIIFLLTFFGCKKSDDGKVEVIPLAPTELKGTIISKDQVDLTWKDNSTNETGYKIERKTDSGNFTEIGDLAQDITTFSDKTVSINTNYTYRVYSFNKVGKSIQYSNEVTIKTINVPILTTADITEITSSGAKSGGNVSADGGSPITARGVVWGTSSNPTISLITKTSDGTGTGSYQSAITGLVASTKYYVRAYATNSAGTGYGNEITLQTTEQSPIPTNGLVALYPFNGNANDESGNGNNGVVSGNTKLTIDRFNLNNKAYLWDGTKSPITIAHNATQNFSTGVTFAVWTYQTGMYCNTCVGTDYVSKGRDINPGGIKLGLIHSNQKFVFSGFSGPKDGVYSIKQINYNTWTHIVGTYDGFTFKIYINGQLDNTESFKSLLVLNSEPMLIGSQKGTNVFADNYNMLGKLDDIGIWNRALTADEISKIFASQGF